MYYGTFLNKKHNEKFLVRRYLVANELHCSCLAWRSLICTYFHITFLLFDGICRSNVNSGPAAKLLHLFPLIPEQTGRVGAWVASVSLQSTLSCLAMKQCSFFIWWLAWSIVVNESRVSILLHLHQINCKCHCDDAIIDIFISVCVNAINDDDTLGVLKVCPIY